MTLAADRVDVLQATAWYPPYHMGGTEVYLSSLIEELSNLEVRSAVLVPQTTGARVAYHFAGTVVETYPVNEAADKRELRMGLPHVAFDLFRKKLASYSGAIYHQHSWTRGCGAHHLRAAKDMGFKTVLTIHVPANICLRGTMMRFGETPCQERPLNEVCGSCWAQARGLPGPLADITGKLPNAVAAMARRFPGRIATGLSARALANEKSVQIQEMVANADCIVAVCQWLYDALVNLGVPAEKLTLSRQGVSHRFASDARAANSERQENKEPLRLLYLGRFDPVKGIHVAVSALRKLKACMPIQLTIYGISGAEPEQAYEARIRQMAAEDQRIVILPPAQRSELARVMSKHDVLVVPSLWLETGPLVVLEAKAAGLLVLGSNLGGIAELVQEPEDGVLLPPGNVERWTEAIDRLAEEKAHGRLLRRSRSVRTIHEVAVEMKTLYRFLQYDYDVGK